MMHDIRFYDTCALLAGAESIFEKGEKFLVSSITLNELEHIKTASNKDADVKYTARLIQRLLEEHQDMWESIFHNIDYEEDMRTFGLEITPDTKILSDAYWANNNKYVDEVIFVTNDLALKRLANLYFGDKAIESIIEEADDYRGYRDITPTEDQLISFYETPAANIFECLPNQYLILRDSARNIMDVRKWTGSEYKHLKSSPFVSDWLGKVEPWNHDIYQQLACDSLSTNKITMLRGPAGTGKSYLALGYLMSQMQKGAIDKIIIFCNTVATANSAKLGFYPGTKNEKLLDSQIGNFLTGKFGGIDGVNKLLESERLLLLPMSDIRGFDTSDMHAGVYITEAQNMDRALMKLALQRIGDDCICIIDGDDASQVDMKAYEGSNNGMRRASKIFRGESIYGEVKLQNIYRSRIAQIAEKI